jgi:hypothetical protein
LEKPTGGLAKLWNSRDIALIITLAVTGFVYTALVFQIGFLFSGIPGSNYLFVIGQAIWNSIAFLLFEGKRWRLLFTITLFSLLTMPTSAMGTPFNILPRIPLILNALQLDVIMNTVYPFFKRRNKLMLAAIVFSLENFIIDGILRLATYPVFYSPEYASTFVGIFLMMLPVIIIESVAGGYLGFKIYDIVSNRRAD